jgi:large subunit ribosomal protein L21
MKVARAIACIPSFPDDQRWIEDARGAAGEVNDWRRMMRYAIIESGGKQFRAVEGETIEVDRLPSEEGKKIEIDHVLFMGDGTDFLIGTPTLGDIEVKATVLDHFSGRKVTHFKYSPKKRIRVRGGHRQQYTRLRVDFIGKPGEERKPTKSEEPQVEAKIPAKKTELGTAKGAPKKAAEKKPAARKPGATPKASGGAREKKPAKK